MTPESPGAAAGGGPDPGGCPSLRGDRPPTAGPDLAGGLVQALTRAGSTIAVAESLTGGAVVEALVAVPGASRCLRGGVVAYATDLKVVLLGVPTALLDRHGPVHPDVARAMAAGVRERLGADYGVATTGVAGPDPQAGRPPGTFHVAVTGPTGTQVVSVQPGPGEPPPERGAVRGAARDAALALAARHVTGGGTGTPAVGGALEPV